VAGCCCNRFDVCCKQLSGIRSCAGSPRLQVKAHLRILPNRTDSVWRPQSEVEDLIWEVDEDCDQTVSWKEFQTMYQRCNTDTAGATGRVAV